MIPNAACTFKNKTTGETIVEDEDDCDYQAKGLISDSATHPCQSKNHNEKSSAVLSTFFNWTLRNAGYSLKESFQYKLPVIAQGAIINIKATRCDGIMECGDGSDENNGCGMEVDDTILAGKTILRYIIFLRI
jgi:hypothetical protein